MATIQTQTTKFSRLFDAFSSLVDKIRTDLPNIDANLALSLIIHKYKYPKEVPRVRLEIVYVPNIVGGEKKEVLYAKTGRCAEIRENHILIIDGYFRLQDIEEIAEDSQIQTIGGGIIS